MAHPFRVERRVVPQPVAAGGPSEEGYAIDAAAPDDPLDDRGHVTNDFGRPHERGVSPGESSAAGHDQRDRS